MQFEILVRAILTLLALGIAFGMPEPKPLPENKLAPVQHHIAYAGETGMVVSWNTYQQVNSPFVKYGLSPDKLNNTAISNVSVTYPTSTTWNNHVKINSLQPNTTYYYQVANSNASQIFKFTTAKKAGSKDEFSFSVVVDLGTMGPLGLSDKSGLLESHVLAPGERNTIQSLEQSIDEFDFLWQPGDLAYADYWLKEELEHYLPDFSISKGYQVYEEILNAFYDEMVLVTSSKPFMVGPGNHEADCDESGTLDIPIHFKHRPTICMPGQTNFTGFKNHFRMPSEESGGLGNFWYSFNYGLVHFVQFNTETDFGNGYIGPEDDSMNGPQGYYPNQQIDWLEKDLASVNRTETPWVIAAGHRPWYVAGSLIYGCHNCKSAFEDVLNKYNVDLVISGHVHNYERHAPIANGKVDPNGLNNPSFPWYIINGIAGHYDGVEPLIYPLPEYTEFAQDSTYGWSKFTVHNCTHLTHEFIASSNNTVLDRATLFKNRKCN